MSIGPMSDETKKMFRKYAWLTLMGFCLVYTFMYNGRLNMGLALPKMTKELGWSVSQAGLIVSVIFWTYGLGHLVNGRLSEIIGVKRFIMAGIILSVICNFTLSFFTSAVVIAIIWGLNGYFQSMVWSPGISLISKWWSQKERGFATGMATGFAGIASIVAWLAVTGAFTVAPEMGWRAAFRLPVLLLFLFAFVYWFMVREKPSDAGLPEYQETGKTKEMEDQYFQIIKEKGKLYPYKVLFGQWRFDFWCIITALYSISRYGLLTWIPLYYVKVMKMQVSAGLFSSVVLPLGMAVGAFAVPWLTDKFCSQNRTPAVVICTLLATASMAVFPYVTDLGLSRFVLFWVGFFIYGVGGVIWAYSADTGNRAFAGTAAGILDWAAYMGAAMQAIVYARVLDATGNWTLVFLSIAAFCLSMVVLALLTNIKPKDQAESTAIDT